MQRRQAPERDDQSPQNVDSTGECRPFPTGSEENPGGLHAKGLTRPLPPGAPGSPCCFPGGKAEGELQAPAGCPLQTTVLGWEDVRLLGQAQPASPAVQTSDWQSLLQ